jgi:nitrogen regulatory protein P-II 1
MHYDKLPKELLMVACKEEDVKTVLDIIVKNARTGSVGDGKIFVLPIEEAITIRSGAKGRDAL